MLEGVVFPFLVFAFYLELWIEDFILFEVLMQTELAQNMW